MSPDYKARKLGLPTMPLKERLYSRVKVDPVSGCWEWQGSKRNGYGRITIGSRKDGSRKSVCAHRADWHTVWDYDKRFSLEDQGLIPRGKFRWDMIADVQDWPYMEGYGGMRRE